MGSDKGGGWGNSFVIDISGGVLGIGAAITGFTVESDYGVVGGESLD